MNNFTFALGKFPRAPDRPNSSHLYSLVTFVLHRELDSLVVFPRGS
jgi:hypothetical protein